ncbi:hypothetical protein DVH24_026067 [Malus domestica]|uniref:Inhibitor I9 domain-containing protein n=1 Tax=Malus domestica TaxID=3750 RepID=A0A498KID6_MALDO|nr:hypothetical protein DVH24_026067 [Malus domestica]
MAKNGAVLLYCALAVFMLGMSLLCKATDEDRKVRIVISFYLECNDDDEAGSYCVLGVPSRWGVLTGVSLLKELSREGSWSRPCFGLFSQYLVLILSHSLSSLESLLVRSYKRSFNGFAAKLIDKEREKLDGEHSDIIYYVTTTKVKCIYCSKLIGARYYIFESARDDIGHGNHTASIAAGNTVKGVSFYGLAQKTHAESSWIWKMQKNTNRHRVRGGLQFTTGINRGR